MRGEPIRRDLCEGRPGTRPRHSAGPPPETSMHATPCRKSAYARRKRERPGREARAFTLNLLARQFRARVLKSAPRQPSNLTPPAPPSASSRVAHPPARTRSFGTGSEPDSLDERRGRPAHARRGRRRRVPRASSACRGPCAGTRVRARSPAGEWPHRPTPAPCRGKHAHPAGSRIDAVDDRDDAAVGLTAPALDIDAHGRRLEDLDRPQRRRRRIPQCHMEPVPQCVLIGRNEWTEAEQWGSSRS